MGRSAYISRKNSIIFTWGSLCRCRCSVSSASALPLCLKLCSVLALCVWSCFACSAPSDLLQVSCVWSASAALLWSVAPLHQKMYTPIQCRSAPEALQRVPLLFGALVSVSSASAAPSNAAHFWSCVIFFSCLALFLKLCSMCALCQCCRSMWCAARLLRCSMLYWFFYQYPVYTLSILSEALQLPCSWSAAGAPFNSDIISYNALFSVFFLKAFQKIWKNGVLWNLWFPHTVPLNWITVCLWGRALLLICCRRFSNAALMCSISALVCDLLQPACSAWSASGLQCFSCCRSAFFYIYGENKNKT